MRIGRHEQKRTRKREQIVSKVVGRMFMSLGIQRPLDLMCGWVPGLMASESGAPW